MVGIRSCDLDNSTVYFTGQVKLLYFANCFFLDEHLRIEINKITKRFDIISLHHVGEEVKQKCLVNMLRKSVKFYQIITYIRVPMRCARTAVGQCTDRSPWVVGFCS